MTTNFIRCGTVYPTGETIPNVIPTGTNGQILMADSTAPRGFSFQNEPSEVLWFSGTTTFASSSIVTFDFTSVGNIDLNQYSIRYEIDVLWNYTDTGYIGMFYNVGLNGNEVTSGTSNPAQTLWKLGQQNPLGTYSVVNQIYQNRFFGGYCGGTGTNTEFRHRTTLNGTISLIRKTLPSPGPSTETASMNSRLIQNRLECNNVVLSVINTDQMRIHINPVAQSGQDKVEGTAFWDTSFDNVWSNSLANGIYSLFLRFTDLNNSSVATLRGGEIKYRIYRCL